MSEQIKLQMTADGSHTLFLPDMDEHYHSVNGAVQESMHVFIESGLRQSQKQDIRVFEIGFGTGLNAFLTLKETLEKPCLHIEYFTIERFPLDAELIAKLNYGGSENELFQKLHTSLWDQDCFITGQFKLHKILGDSNTTLLPDNLDLVYFDAFAPDKQPEMWNQEIFNKLYAQMNPEAILTTYCAKGAVRRMMKEAGFSVERIPGPPGKREMLRARKI